MVGMLTPAVQGIRAWSPVAAPAVSSDDQLPTADIASIGSARSSAAMQAGGLIGSAILTSQDSAEAEDAIGSSAGIRSYYEQMADPFDPAEEPVIFGLRDDVATIESFWI